MNVTTKSKFYIIVSIIDIQLHDHGTAGWARHLYVSFNRTTIMSIIKQNVARIGYLYIIHSRIAAKRQNIYHETRIMPLF